MSHSLGSFVIWHAKFFKARFPLLILERSGTLKARIASKLSSFAFVLALVAVELDIARLIEYPKAISYLKPEKRDRILDIGCGSSCFPTFLCRFYGPEIILIDIEVRSLKMQYTAEKNITHLNNGTKIHLVRADARYLPFRKKTFTKIYSISSIEHVPYGENMVSEEIERVLRDGGVCVLSFPYSAQPKEPQTVPYYMKWYTDSDVETNILEPSNLKISEKYLFEKRYVQLLLQPDSYLRMASLGWIITHCFIGLFFHKLDDSFLKQDKNANGCILKLTN